MTLATVDADGAPDARMVLLKGFGPTGFASSPTSSRRRARSSAALPRAALVVYWRELDRQVRVRGRGGAALRRRVGRVLREPGRATRSSAPGPRRRVGRCPTAPSSTSAATRPRRGSRAARSRGPPFWGGFAGPPGHDRVLAGPGRPRFTTVSATRERRGLAARAAGSVNPCEPVEPDARCSARARRRRAARRGRRSGARPGSRGGRSAPAPRCPSACSSASSARTRAAC